MVNWHYVDTEGNPSTPGTYWVVVVYDEYRDSKPTGRKLADVETRVLADIDDASNNNWVMHGQPDSGLLWMEECGSGFNEYVWAWAPMEETPFPERLPVGVVKNMHDY